MFVGLSTYSFPWAMAVSSSDRKSRALQLLRHAARHQVKYVQFGDNLPLDAFMDAELNILREFSAKNKIAIQVGTKGLTIANIERYIQLARFFNSPFIRMVIDDNDYRPTPKACVTTIKEIIPLLKKENLVLAIENHDRFKAATFRQIILETDPSCVGICLDTANSLGAGESIEQILPVLSPFTVNVHLKDIKINRVKTKMGFTVEGVPAGDGIINIPFILQQLSKTGRCATATLELWVNEAATIEQTLLNERKMVRKSLHYLKQLLS